MDPGMAFGTGHHATTALALEMVSGELKRGGEQISVLDVGTGTGVLAMAAALLGAERVLAIDNDPVAVSAAAENTLLNKLSDRMVVTGAPLSSVAPQYSLVIANIVHDVLVMLSADLERVTEPGGRLVLSGILHGMQVESIIRRFNEAGFRLIEEQKRDEWAALLMEKAG